MKGDIVMQTFCRDDASEILREIGSIGLDKCMNAIAKEYPLSERFLLQMGHLVDIYTISGLQPMSVNVYKKYHNRLNWDVVSQLIKLDPVGIDFIMKNLEYVNIPTIIRRMERHRDEHSLSYLIDLAIHKDVMTEELWDVVSKNIHVSSEFMRKYKLYINWYLMSSNRNIPEDMLLAYANKLNWRVIWNTRQLSEELIVKLIDSSYADCAIDWPLICSTQVLSEAFMKYYRKELDWCIVSEYQNMSYTFMMYNRDKVCVDRLLKNHTIDQATIDKYLANFNNPEADPDEPNNSDDPEWGAFDDVVPPIPTPKPPVDEDEETDEEMYWGTFDDEE